MMGPADTYVNPDAAAFAYYQSQLQTMADMHNDQSATSTQPSHKSHGDFPGDVAAISSHDMSSPHHPNYTIPWDAAYDVAPTASPPNATGPYCYHPPSPPLSSSKNYLNPLRQWHAEEHPQAYAHDTREDLNKPSYPASFYPLRAAPQFNIGSRQTHEFDKELQMDNPWTYQARNQMGGISSQGVPTCHGTVPHVYHDDHSSPPFLPNPRDQFYTYEDRRPQQVEYVPSNRSGYQQYALPKHNQQQSGNRQHLVPYRIVQQPYSQQLPDHQRSYRLPMACLNQPDNPLNSIGQLPSLLPPIHYYSAERPSHRRRQSYGERIAAAIDLRRDAEKAIPAGFVIPSPGQVGTGMLDNRSLRKQETYRRRAEAHRQSISQSRQLPSLSSIAHHGEQFQASSIGYITEPAQAAKRGTKRKKPMEAESIAQPTLAPAVRYAYAPPLHNPDHESKIDRSTLNYHIKSKISIPPHENVSSFIASPSFCIPTPRLDHDELEQSIVTEYSQYKWSVKLYRINPFTTGYEFAQSWLEDQFAALDFKYTYKWFSHLTFGFMKGGDRLSFLVLHNATNPFMVGEPPTSTTTIGVYGCHWYQHDTIFWKTFAPGLKDLINMAMSHCFVQEVTKWHIDMNAYGKRFHRAYWLSANRLKLGKLLEQSSQIDISHNSVPGDDDFEVTEADLCNDWPDVSYDEAAKAWDDCMEESKTEPPKCFEHLVTGSSEW